MNWAVIWSVSFFLLDLVVVVRALTRDHRTPASRLAWVTVIFTLPGLGIVAYFLFGDPSANARMDRRLTALRKELPRVPLGGTPDPELPPLYTQSFARAASLNGFVPVAGNRAELTADSNEAIDWLVADIEAAKGHAHLLFYIWLPDHNGTRVAEAMIAAATRGVNARVIVDGLGSRTLLSHPLWRKMQEAGVECVVAFDISYPLFAALYQRLDIRNHRKIVVIDHNTTYVGSQNCADPEFLIKAKYAPWVDTMLRIEGPVAWQAQRLFVGDWMAHGGPDISEMLDREAPVPEAPGKDSFTAVMAGTGAVQTYEGVPDMIQMLLASAQHEVVITTPYYVPSDALHGQICSAAKRGVRVRVNLPARNDSWIVGMAAQSYFSSFLKAGVELYQFHGGLLHAKLLTVDGQVGLVGSANLDRRSFDLNFENSMMLQGADVVGEIRAQQERFLQSSEQVMRDDVVAWTRLRRLVINGMGTLAPLL
ncbi:phospholipase D-like domain-containing protein [Aliiroseovarius lamellibrachiae]|uniref:phospholipase D-like domain-containing protein n=1 Tax=Aliiroseovarius lamellibrachiae TaxID=1924933 RepID=UPI001BE0DA3A|nr:phospholipase D-like domain-containing protein [Aliiroseovarius lamellibrachiae]MBT2130978.1 PLDc N-terminal domain-containing protein [Aliiroseovarius lamellibrachiae]